MLVIQICTPNRRDKFSFKLNVKLYPNAWNPYDSLGEAYALAGNKELAIKNYQKSIDLNPKNDNGITALKKLKEK